MTVTSSYRAVAVIALAVALATGAGCSGAPAVVARAEARNITTLGAPGMPDRLAGLVVRREDVSDAVGAARRPYLDALALFSLRSADRLEATLQIGRLARGTRVDDRFREAVLAGIGGGAVEHVRIGERDVHLTSVSRQTLAVWFDTRHFYVLATRDDFAFPRALLREALELTP